MASRGEIIVYPSAAALAQALAERFVSEGAGAIAERGEFAVALSGGTTPRAAYQLLATGAFRSQLDWKKVSIFFGDERCVPPDDERSNFKMAETAFLDAVPIPPENVHRMAGEIEPGRAANEYASVLRAARGETPHFDLVLLGLGEDGHTASLFPGALPEADEGLVRAVWSPAQEMWRITLTPRAINNARSVVFAVEGAGKAAILAAVLEGPLDSTRYPAQVVAPASGRLTWMLDSAAAAQLQPEDDAKIG